MRVGISILLSFIVSFCFGQHNVLDELNRTVNSTWITDNPELERTEASFFDEDNSKTSFVVPIKISGLSIPFTWDCDLSILDFLVSQDTEISIKKGKEADPNFLGTKIKWSNKKSALIWIDQKFYHAQIDNWYLFGQTECPGTNLFPALSFDKLFDLKDAVTNNLNGIAIIPYNPDIDHITRSNVQLLTTNKRELNGTGYDLNSDNILDVFIHYESLNEEGTRGYKRLYLNVEGSWNCKWSEYYEECI